MELKKKNYFHLHQSKKDLPVWDFLLHNLLYILYLDSQQNLPDGTKSGQARTSPMVRANLEVERERLCETPSDSANSSQHNLACLPSPTSRVTPVASGLPNKRVSAPLLLSLLVGLNNALLPPLICLMSVFLSIPLNDDVWQKIFMLF